MRIAVGTVGSMLIGFPRFATVVHTLSAFTSSRLPVAHVAESWSRSSRLTAVPYSLEGSRGCEIKVDYRGYHYMGIRGLGTHLRKMKVNGEQEVITKVSYDVHVTNMIEVVCLLHVGSRSQLVGTTDANANNWGRGSWILPVRSCSNTYLLQLCVGM